MSNMSNTKWQNKILVYLTTQVSVKNTWDYAYVMCEEN